MLVDLDMACIWVYPNKSKGLGQSVLYMQHHMTISRALSELGLFLMASWRRLLHLLQCKRFSTRFTLVRVPAAVARWKDAHSFQKPAAEEISSPCNIAGVV